MMRIQPDPESLPALRPAASAASSDNAFAKALAALRDAPGGGPGETDGEANEPPPAERWGEYGRGATALGFGPAPDPSEFSDAPVGPHEPASPLNPSGVTTKPSFIVPGYTARGTPIPPGFYNLSYYNRYLEEGGTPLEGFPLRAEGATITETYGKFGDGAARATSFLAATDPPDDGCDDAAASAADTEAATVAAEASSSPAQPTEPHVPAQARTERVAVPSSVQVQAAANSRTTAPVPTTPSAGETARAASPQGEMPAAKTDLGATLGAEIAALLSDLLRVT